MTASYLTRLVCLCLACFFVVHVALGIAVAVLTPAAIRIAERLRASRGAALLLSLRLLPSAAAILVVACLCAPSYLWLEPQATQEDVGGAFLAMGLATLTLWSLSLTRGFHAALKSGRYLRQCRRIARKSGPFWIVDVERPLLMLAGVLHPQLIVSRGVRAALTPDQFAAALRHERAHRASHDNGKRLLMLLTPDLLPFVRGFGALERGWARLTEWAADDRAVSGNGRRSLSLAAALVSVARLGSTAQPSPLATSLLADRNDLSKRVDRLLAPVPVAKPAAAFWPAAATAVCAALALALFRSETLYTVHHIMERLVH